MADLFWLQRRRGLRNARWRLAMRSAAYRRSRLTSFSPHRVSIRTRLARPAAAGGMS